MSADDSYLLSVRVKPRAKRAGLLGWHGGALKVAVRAVPERGRANAELLKILSTALGIPEAALEVASGVTSQDKRIRVADLAPEEIRRRLEIALADEVG